MRFCGVKHEFGFNYMTITLKLGCEICRKKTALGCRRCVASIPVVKSMRERNTRIGEDVRVIEMEKTKRLIPINKTRSAVSPPNAVA